MIPDKERMAELVEGYSRDGEPEGLVIPDSMNLIGGLAFGEDMRAHPTVALALGDSGDPEVSPVYMLDLDSVIELVNTLVKGMGVVVTEADDYNGQLERKMN